MNNQKEPLIYKGCSSTFFSAATLLVSILGAGLLTIISFIIEVL